VLTWHGGRESVKRRKFQDSTIDQLAECFAELVLAAANAPISETDRLQDAIREIEDELKARGREHHTDLLPLAQHTDERVRFEAVAATFRIMLGDPRITTDLVRRLAIATDAPFLAKSQSPPRVVRMSRDKLKKLTTAELVARFVEIGLAQDKALLYDEIGKFNRLFDLKQDVVNELKSRSGDQRHALLTLYDHPNLQVRLNAVKSSLALALEEGRRVLQAIADSRHYPQAGDAGMCLSNLDEGIFKRSSPSPCCPRCG
jgi:hypothetical protein